MKKITIKATDFFELLKLKDQSMWDIFASLIDGEEKELIFVDENNEFLFNYILPTDFKKLQDDKAVFSKEYSEKLSGLN